MIKEILVTFGILLTLSGCANSIDRQINMQNITLEQKQQPDRLYKTKSTDKADFYTMEWAGAKGRSMAFGVELLYADILKGFKLHCGFDEADLVETRIVSYQFPVSYEVWIFKDPLSQREDKTSAMSVILKQLPNGGGVDMNFIGQCHSKPLQLVFGK